MKKYVDRRLRKIKELEDKPEKYNKDELSFLYNLAKSKDVEMRGIAAMLLADQYAPESEEVLYHLSFDKDYAVTLEAIDSLCIGRSMKTLQRLETLINSADGGIKVFALMSYYDVSENIYGDSFKDTFSLRLKNMLETEEEPLLKATIYYLMYMCGEKETLTLLESLLVDAVNISDYGTSWRIMRIFDEIIDEETQEEIISTLNKVYEKVQTTQQEFIDELKQQLSG